MTAAGELPFALKGRRIWVAGHRGMVGRALVKRLGSEDCEILVPAKRIDLRSYEETATWLQTARPQVIFLAAARVGGILANSTRPAEFIYDNLAIQTNVIHLARQYEVQKLVLLGSSCIYPKHAPQPIPEGALLGGPLEPTNEWYAIAKIAGLKLGQAYRAQYGLDCIAAMPTNLYGPWDNFDPVTSHVLPGLLGKAHRAKLAGAAVLDLWGTGKPRREFLHVDDCADAIVFLAKHYSASEHVNVGTGTDISIRELAEIVAEVTGFKGEFAYDSSKPDGTPRKLLDVSRLTELGWQATIPLRDGIQSTYQWYCQHLAQAPGH